MSGKTIFWWLINIGVWILIYQGAYNHIEWYENVLKFYVGLVLFLSVMNLLFFRTIKSSVGSRPVPTWVAVSAGILETVAFAGAGWLWSAGINLFATFIEYLIYDVD